MSFDGYFGDDLERNDSSVTLKYKDFPEFERTSSLIDKDLNELNQKHLVELKRLLTQYGKASEEENMFIGQKITKCLAEVTELFKKVNTLIKDMTKYIKLVETEREDVEVINYLRQKENLLIRLTKDSLVRFKKYQNEFESFLGQVQQPSGAGAGTGTGTGADASNIINQDGGQLQQQEQVQIAYEPINAEQLEEQTLQIEEREREVHRIQQDTVEINEIFSNLSSIINEQQFQIDNIENNLFNYSTEVRGADNELRRAARSQKRSSGRMFCCLIILLGVMGFIIFIGIIF